MCIRDRVKALLRRYCVYQGKGQPGATYEDNMLSAQGITIALDHNQVWVRGEERDLTEIEYQIPVSYTHLDVYKRQLQNLGIGGAVQTGYLYAQREGYDIAVQFDGDGQHDLNSLPQLLAPVVRGDCDFCAVSYTHLDVYKRQPHSANCPAGDTRLRTGSPGCPARSSPGGPCRSP